MKNDIKRTAQFLFDNAEFIAEELERSDNYRVLEIGFRLFKHGDGNHQEIELRLYDDTDGGRTLTNDDIRIERFEILCRQIDEATGVIPKPENTKVRDKL